MNAAHLHLVLNHLPVIGIPLAGVFLFHSAVTRNGAALRFAFIVMIAASASTLPAFFTGEPAEEIIEHLPGVAESFIEKHEDAGKVSLILSVASGAAAITALWFGRSEARARLALKAALALAILATISLAYTANLGGKIRHTELRGEASGTPRPADNHD